ncbi:MAG: hypothetical protein ACOYMN_08860 [Roseimicrobium sp.]
MLLIVQGVRRADSLPLTSEAKDALVEAVGQLAERYSKARDGLAPRAFFYQFQSSSLMVLFTRLSSLYIWLDASANIAEAEVAGRKLISTAHLSGDRTASAEFLVPGKASFIVMPAAEKVRRKSNRPPKPAIADATTVEAVPTVPPSLKRPSLELSTLPLTKIMSWHQARTALESILTKVLAQAQASRLIDRALSDRGIMLEMQFDVRLFRQVGLELMQQIPHRSLRRSLTNEFEALVAKLS